MTGELRYTVLRCSASDMIRKSRIRLKSSEWSWGALNTLDSVFCVLLYAYIMYTNYILQIANIFYIKREWWLDEKLLIRSNPNARIRGLILDEPG